MENSGLRLSDTVCTATLGPINKSLRNNYIGFSSKMYFEHINQYIVKESNILYPLMKNKAIDAENEEIHSYKPDDEQKIKRAWPYIHYGPVYTLFTQN